jgi:hypothetical protein
MRSVMIIHRATQVQYAEPQEDHIFFRFIIPLLFNFIWNFGPIEAI